MTADLEAVLDACVILPMPLADTLFRMAEEPRLYVPRWTDEIMAEVSRNLVSRFQRTPGQAAHREGQLRKAFPSAWVDERYRLLIPDMANHEKDRHVLAAAVQAKAELIVTYNLRDFPRAALEPFGIACKGPSAFLRDLFELDPEVAAWKLHEQAGRIGISLEDLMARLKALTPGFVDFACERMGIRYPV